MCKPKVLCIAGFFLAASAFVAVAQSKAEGKIAKAVAGKLVKAAGKEVKPYVIDASPKYYVIYHSASW